MRKKNTYTAVIAFSITLTLLLSGSIAVAIAGKTTQTVSNNQNLNEDVELLLDTSGRITTEPKSTRLSLSMIGVRRSLKTRTGTSCCLPMKRKAKLMP